MSVGRFIWCCVFCGSPQLPCPATEAITKTKAKTQTQTQTQKQTNPNEWSNAAGVGLIRQATNATNNEEQEYQEEEKGHQCKAGSFIQPMARTP